MGTRVGESVLAYGTWGELCPVLAMALLLSTRAEWKTVLILMAFMALCVLVAVVPAKAKKAGHRLFRFLTANAEGTSQTMMRVTVLLLVGLVALSAAFDLDIVLGAFAAGFVLRYIIPEGDHALEHKLDGVAYGFLIPIFFVVSGAKIDLAAVFQQPEVLVGFIALLLLIRAVPIFVALSTGKDTRDISTHNRLTIALYCTTALPIIVAVTSVAVSAGAMPQETASVLVAAGAITVFLMPLLGMLTYRVADAKPIEAVREIAHNPRDIGDILREHWELERMLARREALERLAARREGRDFEDLDWQDRAALLQRASARKRAIDEALDLASQEMARRALVDDADPDGDGPRLADRQQRREERRRLVAEHAVREYRRRMNELGGAAERMGVSREDARRLFEDAHGVQAAGPGRPARHAHGTRRERGRRAPCLTDGATGQARSRPRIPGVRRAAPRPRTGRRAPGTRRPPSARRRPRACRTSRPASRRDPRRPHRRRRAARRLRGLPAPRRPPRARAPKDLRRRRAHAASGRRPSGRPSPRTRAP